MCFFEQAKNEHVHIMSLFGSPLLIYFPSFGKNGRPLASLGKVLLFLFWELVLWNLLQNLLVSNIRLIDEQVTMNANQVNLV